jgi:hypothetical protein
MTTYLGIERLVMMQENNKWFIESLYPQVDLIAIRAMYAEVIYQDDKCADLAMAREIAGYADNQDLLCWYRSVNRDWYYQRCEGASEMYPCTYKDAWGFEQIPF